MKKSFSLCTYLLFTASCLVAQEAQTIKGSITSADNGQPIPSCSVFITGTSIGTISNTKGEFVLTNVPAGTYDLIVSSIGYETFVYSYRNAELPLQLAIKLKPKEQLLASVEIEPYEKYGWKKWGKTFTNNFIGTVENAKQCSIKNRKVLHFRFSKRANRLTVFSDEPLVIENRALGYIIKYQLEQFTTDFSSGMVSFYGYPLFEEMETQHPRRKLQWLENRKKAYLGSIAHFIQSLDADKLQQQGFELQRWVRAVDREKQRVRDLYRSLVPASDTFQMGKNGLVQTNKPMVFPKDSLLYYESVLARPDSYEKYLSLSAADIVVTNGDGTKAIFFKDHLLVDYNNTSAGAHGQSEIYLVTPSPVLISNSGNYYPPQELITAGYWGLNEKIANELPLDYIIQAFKF